jgi:hypothetical protein
LVTFEIYGRFYLNRPEYLVKSSVLL